jgi:hypothetical protein
MRLFSRLLLFCVAFALLVPAFASAASNGTLTHAEYQQLEPLYKFEKQLKGSDALNKLGERCKAVNGVSALAREQLTGCLDQIAWFRASTKAAAAAKTCEADNKSVNARFDCMLPSYEIVKSTTAAFYQNDLDIARLARARGLSSRCVAFLAEPPDALTDESKMTRDISQMVATMREHRRTALVVAGDSYTSDAAALQTAEVKFDPNNAWLCPHQ